MNRYDDDHVIALLRDAVPPPPQAGDRIPAVKQRAGHQRAMMWTQTIGAMASVLLVVGVAAAVATGGPRQRVEPTARPLEALAAAFAEQTSVRFEASMKLLGDPEVPFPRLSPEQFREIVDSRLTGAVTRAGDAEADGDLSFATGFFGIASGGDGVDPASLATFRTRLVDGVQYRTPEGTEKLPPGKKWIRGDADESEEDPAVELDRGLKVLNAIASDVRHVGGGTVRGTPVAEYVMTISKRYTNSVDLRVRFALDAENRLRHASTELSLRDLLFGGFDEDESGSAAEMSPPPGRRPFPLNAPGQPRPTPQERRAPQWDPLNVRIELELFDYGADVDIQAPPASEVITEDELWNDRRSAISRCLDTAKDSRSRDACFQSHDSFGEDTAESCDTGSDGTTTCSSDASVPPPPPSGQLQTIRPSPTPGGRGDPSSASPTP